MTRRRALMAKVESGGGLPAEYQEVAYLRSDGVQYIDTGIVPSTYLNAMIDFSPANKKTYVFGSTNGAGNGYYGLNCYASLELYYGRGGLLSGSYNAGERMQITVDDLSWYKNGTLLHTFDPYTYTSNNSLWLFGLNHTTKHYAFCDIYRFKLWETDLLIDLIPCYRKADNKPGMYDLVSGNFFVNQRTNRDFYLGPDIN